MTTEDQATIHLMLRERISLLETNLNSRLDATEKTVSERFDRQDKDLRDIKTQTTKTNGRVTTLENARARAQGVMFAFKWVPPVLASIVTAGLTILMLALTGGIR